MKSIKKKRSMASHRKLHFQKVLGSMIVALALLFAGSAGAQETKTIKGMVRDVTGEPLIGASVIEKGTNNGVITDVDGNFTLTVPADATLSIAYMGYAHPRNTSGKTQEAGRPEGNAERGLATVERGGRHGYGYQEGYQTAGLRGEHYRIGRDSEGGSNQLCIRHVR